MLILDHISKTFHPGTVNERQALCDLSLTVEDGDFITIIGANGAGGEIGHIHIEDDETELCGCQNTGCLEQYTSATGIVRLAKRRLAKDDKPSALREGTLSAKSVFDAVKAGDELAIEVAEQFGDYLGKGLAGVAGTVNPEIFVIGGGVYNPVSFHGYPVHAVCHLKHYSSVSLITHQHIAAVSQYHVRDSYQMQIMLNIL